MYVYSSDSKVWLYEFILKLLKTRYYDTSVEFYIIVQLND